MSPYSEMKVSRQQEQEAHARSSALSVVGSRKAELKTYSKGDLIRYALRLEEAVELLKSDRGL
ncbi:hypothetical protein LCW13_05910 [Cobetia amphilecti]|jgi:hypothetical protein|uniref:hypothetical protein n=1 Tax=Cobetia amphilecti TaxID=1055104 RepID=UPI001CDB3E3F|nr:hypothetical protein [Cobetia amphilecti]UBU49789.1 hypothetical protein LCW13_05910 [Cobetia amphilecti]